LRRWVKYEIARAIIDGRGLLAVHINNIRHHQTLTAHTLGYNPLDYIAVGKVQDSPWGPVRYYLFEKNAVRDALGNYVWQWHRYGDFTGSVNKPSWLADPVTGHVTVLSAGADLYDYVNHLGHTNIGGWIDRAAQKVGR
jgi:hypothetical protein